MRRAGLLWLILLAAYAGTLGLDAFGDSDYAGNEPHYLLSAQSIIEDGDLDVKNQYAARAYEDFYPYRLERHGVETAGRLHEPHGAGFPLLIAPAYAAGGAHGVELFLAAIAALGGALGYLLALRLVPDPWALGTALAAGLSPPLLAFGSAVYPELAAGAAIAGAALLAARLEQRISRREVFACSVLLGTLPWLGPKFVPAGIVVGLFAIRSLLQAKRGMLALGAAELAGFSAALYVGVNESLYRGPTPYAAEAAGETATGTDFPGGYLSRSYRLVALLADRDYGLLRWAPVFVLVLAGLWLLYRSRRDRLARAVPALGAAERVGFICAGVLGVQMLVATFLAPTMFGLSFPPRHLVAALPLAVGLAAWGLRHFPRAGSALAALSVAASAWLYLDVRFGGGGLATPRPDAPFGPLTGLFPSFRGSDWPYAFAAAVGCGAILLALLEARRRHGAFPPRTPREGPEGD